MKFNKFCHIFSNKFSNKFFSTIISKETFNTLLNKNDFKNIELLILKSLTSSQIFSEVLNSKESFDILIEKLKSQGNFNDSIKTIQLYINTLSSLPIDIKETYKLILESNLTLADSYDKMNKLNLSEDCVNKNIKILEDLILVENESIKKINYESYLALMYFNKGFYQFKMGEKDYREQFDNFNKFYENNFKNKLEEIDLIIRKELGTALQNLKNYKEAIHVYKTILNNNSDVNIQILSYKNIIECFINLNDKEKAIEYLEKYKNLLQENYTNSTNINNLYFELARIYEGLSQDFLNESDFSKSELMINNAENFYNKSEIKEDIYLAATTYIKANIYDGLKRSQDSINSSQKFLTIISNFTQQTFNKEGDYLNSNLKQIYDHNILSYREQIFYSLSCYYIIAQNYLKLNETEKAKEYFIKVHQKVQENILLFENQTNYESLMNNLKLRIALGNKQVRNFEECLKDLDYVIQNINNIENTLYAWFNKAVCLCEMEEYERSKQNILEMLEFIRQREINLKENKLQSMYKLLVKVEKEIENKIK